MQSLRVLNIDQAATILETSEIISVHEVSGMTASHVLHGNGNQALLIQGSGERFFYIE